MTYRLATAVTLGIAVGDYLFDAFNLINPALRVPAIIAAVVGVAVGILMGEAIPDGWKQTWWPSLAGAILTLSVVVAYTAFVWKPSAAGSNTAVALYGLGFGSLFFTIAALSGRTGGEESG